ncbi:MAG: hypothetical protein M5U31_04840 [Acidimicrobiia bacterium]|nr:hypothetical protein [Acidimicrobiia bacterium]
MRVVVRVEMSQQLLAMLMIDIDNSCKELEKEQPTHDATGSGDLWTAPHEAADRAKRRFWHKK